MKRNITKLERFVELQSEFSEKETILQYIRDMKTELQHELQKAKTTFGYPYQREKAFKEVLGNVKKQ